MTLKKDLIFNDNLKIYVQQNPGLCLFLAADVERKATFY